MMSLVVAAGSTAKGRPDTMWSTPVQPRSAARRGSVSADAHTQSTSGHARRMRSTKVRSVSTASSVPLSPVLASSSRVTTPVPGPSSITREPGVTCCETFLASWTELGAMAPTDRGFRISAPRNTRCSRHSELAVLIAFILSPPAHRA